MNPSVVLRKKLNGSDLVLGVLITNHLWLELIEIASIVGLDYAIIDTEHFDHGNTLIADALRLARVLNFPVLVRTNETSTNAVRLALDLGPCGLVLPMVDTAEQLDAVANGMHLPPRGHRRPGAHGNRWVNAFTGDAFRTQVEDHILIVPQIESPRGVANAREIATHPITTAVGLGPFDLSAYLGICGQMDHPDLLAAQGKIQDAAREANKPTWIVGDPGVRSRQGFRFICVAETTMLLEATLRNMVTNARNQQDKSR